MYGGVVFTYICYSVIHQMEKANAFVKTIVFRLSFGQSCKQFRYNNLCLQTKKVFKKSVKVSALR